MIVMGFEQLVLIFFGAAAGNIVFNVARGVYGVFFSRDVSTEKDEHEDEDEDADDESEDEDDDGAEDVTPLSGGPYRTLSALGVDVGVVKENLRLFEPRTTCPRCGDYSIMNRGRYKGKHTYDLRCRGVLQKGLECSGHDGKPHVHYQCYECGVDWAEIPPEDYDEKVIAS